MKALDVDDHLGSLIAEGRVLLAITPDGPPSTWTSWGLGADVARDRGGALQQGRATAGVAVWRSPSPAAAVRHAEEEQRWTGFDMSMYAIRRRPGRRRPFKVRWKAAGRGRSRSFITRRLADSYRPASQQRGTCRHPRRSLVSARRRVRGHSGRVTGTDTGRLLQLRHDSPVPNRSICACLDRRKFDWLIAPIRRYTGDRKPDHYPSAV